MKQNQAFIHGTYSNVAPFFVGQSIFKTSIYEKLLFFFFFKKNKLKKKNH